MPINGQVGTVKYDEVRARGAAHPPVIVSGTFAGGSKLALGLILARKADGSYAPYNPSGSAPLNKPVAVLDEDLDTDRSTSGMVIIHGSALAVHLKVGAGGDKPNAAQLAALRDAGVYPE